MAFALKFFTCFVLTVCIVASVDAAISCGTVSSSLAQCGAYLTKGGAVPPPCCAGVKTLNGMAQATPDRQQAYRCLQSTAKSIPGLNPSFASSLPGKCGVSLPYPISTSINCATIK